MVQGPFTISGCAEVVFHLCPLELSGFALGSMGVTRPLSTSPEDIRLSFSSSSASSFMSKPAYTAAGALKVTPLRVEVGGVRKGSGETAPTARHSSSGRKVAGSGQARHGMEAAALTRACRNLP